MCMAALHWARVETVYFGATVQDAADIGFNELYIDAQKILSMGGSKVKLIGNTLAAECKQLFADYKKMPSARTY
jgi:tRNA(Arg) A34 adenosine deaminase TadA